MLKNRKTIQCHRGGGSHKRLKGLHPVQSFQKDCSLVAWWIWDRRTILWDVAQRRQGNLGCLAWEQSHSSSKLLRNSLPAARETTVPDHYQYECLWRHFEIAEKTAQNAEGNSRQCQSDCPKTRDREAANPPSGKPALYRPYGRANSSSLWCLVDDEVSYLFAWGHPYKSYRICLGEGYSSGQGKSGFSAILTGMGNNTPWVFPVVPLVIFLFHNTFPHVWRHVSLMWGALLFCKKRAW